MSDLTTYKNKAEIVLGSSYPKPNFFQRLLRFLLGLRTPDQHVHSYHWHNEKRTRHVQSEEPDDIYSGVMHEHVWYRVLVSQKCVSCGDEVEIAFRDPLSGTHKEKVPKKKNK